MNISRTFYGLWQGEKASKGNAKVVAFAKVAKEHPKELKQILTYTYNPFYQYGISPEGKDYRKAITTDFSQSQFRCRAVWNNFLAILDALRAHQLTGDDAHSTLRTFFPCLYKDYTLALWCKRVLSHNLRIGLQPTTFKKFFPGLLPELKLQLCTHECADDIVLDKGTYCAEPKLDGLRLIAIKHDGVVSIVSRGNKQFWNTECIIHELKKLPNDTVLDGEAFAGNHAKTVSILKTQHKHADRRKLKFIVFHYLPYADWIANTCTQRYYQQRVILERLITPKFKYLVLNTSTVIRDNFEELYDTFVQSGYEGIVIKKSCGKYEYKRSKVWQAIKPVESEKFTVYKVAEGKDRNEGTCGSLYIKGSVKYRGKTYKIDTRCGTMTDKMRRWFWKHKKQAIGLRVEILYDSPTSQTTGTKNKGTYALRFPRFKCLTD